MKAITIKQPWASLICWVLKDIENRTWKTNFRGRVFVHAGAQWYENVKNVPTLFTFWQGNEISRKDKNSRFMEALLHKELPLSAIIGEVEIIDCVENHPSIWAMEGQFHWVLTNAIQYETPIPCKGALSFWTPDAETLKLCEEMRVKL